MKELNIDLGDEPENEPEKPAEQGSKFAISGFEGPVALPSAALRKTILTEAEQHGFRASRPKRVGRPPQGRNEQISIKVRPEFAELMYELKYQTREPYNAIIEKAVCEAFGYDFDTLKKIPKPE